jgi:hypothetical protein
VLLVLHWLPDEKLIYRQQLLIFIILYVSASRCHWIETQEVGTKTVPFIVTTEPKTDEVK